MSLPSSFHTYMGTEEMGEQTPPSTTGAMPFPPEWAAFQAFYSSGMAPMPPPNPYMWGAQPIMPPYGAPPFTSIYPHGGMYAHPSVSAGNHPYSPYGLATGNVRDAQGALVPDAEGKSKNGNAKSPSKPSSGGLGNLARPNSKGEEPQKLDAERLASINEYGSNSADSGSEGSTEESEENSLIGITDQLFPKAPNRDLQDVDLLPRPISMSTQSVGAEANTSLNKGINHWNGGASLFHSGGQGKRSGSAATFASPISMRGHAVAGELCLQDERDLKRQRRKQSNRESARRSRLRKQTECEILATRVEALSQENTALRSKLNQVTEEYTILSKENCSLLGQLQLCKPEDVHGLMEENTKF